MKILNLNGRYVIFFVMLLLFSYFVNADPVEYVGENEVCDSGTCSCYVEGGYSISHGAYCEEGINNCDTGFQQTCQEIIDPLNPDYLIDCSCNCIGPEPECIPGQVRECGYSNIGICQLGTEICLGNSQWSGNCIGAIYPQEEVCENGIDENCDGIDSECLSIEYFYNNECGDANERNSWGKLCKADDFSGSTEFEYDDKGNIIKQEVSIDGYDNQFIIEYEYDSYGNLVKERLPNNDVIEYIYNNLNQIENVKYNDLDIDFSYNTDGLVEDIDYENGVDTDYEYDFRDRVKEIDIGVGSEEIFNRKYVYDNVGNLRFLYKNLDLLAEFIYDNLYRLTTVNDDNYYNFNLLSFEYDKGGNRLSKSEDNNFVTYSYEPLSNRLLSIDTGGDDILELEYDSSGNLVEINDIKKYDYNIDNMLISVFKDNGAVDEQYLYNYKNQRVKKIKGVIPSNPQMNGLTEITYYIYDIKGNMVYSLYKTINNEIIKSPVGGAVISPSDCG